MKRKIKAILVTMLAMIVFLKQETYVFASKASYDFQAYENKLTEINSEFGTAYQLTPASGETYGEMVSYFLSMSLEEFEEYIRECHVAEEEFDSIVDNLYENIASNNNVSPSSLDHQKYFYAYNSNYFYLKAYTATAGGITTYTGTVSSVGYSINEYPAYSAPTYSIEFADDMRTATVTYNCVKYLSERVTDAVLYSIDVIYGAGTGDSYPVLIAKK